MRRVWSKGRRSQLQIKSHTRCFTPKRVMSWRGPISASLCPGNTAFDEMSQQWQAVGNTVSDWTGPGFEPRISRSRDERVIARPTGRLDPNLSA